MGWRKKMGVAQETIVSEAPIQKVQNIQKAKEMPKIETFVPSVPFAPKIQKIKTYQKQFDSLWKKAWALADWIDDSASSVPWQERAARVPELQELSLEIDRLKATDDFSPIPKPHGKVQIDQAVCPARCKQAGKCYGTAYFDAKPGKALLCMPDQCPWSNQLKQHFNTKEN